MPIERSIDRRTPKTREAIVSAARQMLAERGFYGMSIAGVAERSGMTRAGVTYHFPTREHVLLAVMDDRFKETTNRFQEQLNLGRSILDVFIELMAWHSDDPEATTLLIVLAGASVDPSNPAHEWYVGRYEFLRTEAASYIQTEQARGDIRKDLEAESIAIQLITTMEGLMLQWLDDRDAVDMVQIMTDYCSLLRTE